MIDGQHRLYGYAHAARGADRDRSVVPVLAYENLPLNEEIELFVDINTRQVKVPRNLVNEIISSLNINDPDPKKQLDALHARIVIRLDEYPSSPVRDRILTVAQDKDHFRCLTLTSFVDGIAGNNLLGSIRRINRKDLGVIDPGPLADLSADPAKTMNKAVVTISKYLNLFAEGLEHHWQLGDEKGGYLCTNNGIRALLVLMRRVITFVEANKSIRVRNLDAEDIVEYISPYIHHVIEYFKNASANDISAFRTRGSSLSTVDQNCFQMMSIIHEKEPSFTTNDLIEYISSQDIEGAKEAKGKIDEINKIIFDDVIERLRARHGMAKDAWWIQGVPKGIRIGCDQRWNESDGDRERYQYLTLSNYPEIIQHENNWEVFRDYYGFSEKGRKKSELIARIQRINSVRNITHHAEKGPLSKKDVDYVRRVHRLVKTHIEGGEKVVPGNLYLAEQREQEPALESAEG